jgi:hypothetical protein
MHRIHARLSYLCTLSRWTLDISKLGTGFMTKIMARPAILAARALLPLSISKQPSCSLVQNADVNRAFMGRSMCYGNALYFPLILMASPVPWTYFLFYDYHCNLFDGPSSSNGMHGYMEKCAPARLAHSRKWHQAISIATAGRVLACRQQHYCVQVIDLETTGRAVSICRGACP